MREHRDGSEGRRQATRTAMISGASFTAGDTVRRCVVVDISASGVRLHLVDGAAAPDQIVLHLPGRVVRPARCRWQRGTEAGFEFVDTTGEAEATRKAENAAPEEPD
jgi:hypothetical protein